MIHVNVRALLEREMNGERHLLVQVRDKPHEAVKCLELPGGRLEEFEPILDCLRREVREETGLEVDEILDDTRRTEESTDAGWTVECLQPFAVYQTTRGPVDSMGLYFRCTARGELLKRGDDARDARWVPVSELQGLAERGLLDFCNIDRAAILHYLIRVN